MVSTGAKVAIGVGAAGSIGAIAAAFILAKPSVTAPPGTCGAGDILLNGKCTPATIDLSAAQGSIVAGESVVFTALLQTTGGVPVANYTVTLQEITTGTSTKSVTNTSGHATFTVTFPDSGNYEFEATA